VKATAPAAARPARGGGSGGRRAVSAGGRDARAGGSFGAGGAGGAGAGAGAGASRGRLKSDRAAFAGAGADAAAGGGDAEADGSRSIARPAASADGLSTTWVSPVSGGASGWAGSDPRGSAGAGRGARRPPPAPEGAGDR
jgi:hypothetical protein